MLEIRKTMHIWGQVQLKAKVAPVYQVQVLYTSYKCSIPEFVVCEHGGTTNSTSGRRTAEFCLVVLRTKCGPYAVAGSAVPVVGRPRSEAWGGCP